MQLIPTHLALLLLLLLQHGELWIFAIGYGDVGGNGVEFLADHFCKDDVVEYLWDYLSSSSLWLLVGGSSREKDQLSS